MTKRLYYTEPYRTTFQATVVASSTIDSRAVVVLDQTAFYPTSGGQPFDIGTMNRVRVLDVVDRDDGEIEHVMESALPIGAEVTGEIDWSRRFDHMQQHTGQHVLSAAFDRMFGVRTESFHLGTASASIDLAREVSAAEISRAEDEANGVVWEDRPVTIRFASAEEVAALPLRKESLRTGPLRLIEVADFDLSACGGTHVNRTGAVGVIAIGGWEKFRGGSRIEFLCGGRALKRFRLWRDALADTQRRLSVAPEELAVAIDRLQAENKTLARNVRAVQEQLAVHEGRALVARGTRSGTRVVVVESLDGWDAQGLKALASAAASDPGVVVALFSTDPSRAFIVARAADVTSVDAGRIVRELTTKFGGRGGGKPDLAQGGGLIAPVEECVAHARDLLAQ
jgi:alanyl-tRNA synthetase